MKTLRLAILTIILATANFCSAQTALSVNDSTLTIGNDTLIMNSNPIINFEIVNSSPVLGYSGNITVEIYNDSSGTGGFGNLNFVNSINIQAATINAASSYFVVDSFSVNPSAFRSGINTVVIWPRAQASSGFVTLDSARHNVFIVQSLSTNELLQTHKIVLYPNPFSSKIWFSGIEINSIEQVRIMNVLGEEIISKTQLEKSMLDLSELPKGIYFIKLQTKDSKQIIIKTIKE